MQSIRQWLECIGLEQYAEAFEKNDVDAEILRDLSEDDLQRLGVSLGHRKRMLRAMEVDASTSSEAPPRQEPSLIESTTAEGERRQVTVLFCDLVGSTALSAKLDPEAYRAVLSRYHQTAIHAIQRFDGYVAQIQGDGILAYFGYPLAHEGEADRAVRAGLEIIAALKVGNGPESEALRVRIGIASGLVVVSHILAPEKSAVGETPNLAHRLQAAAYPDEVIVSTRTQQLAGRGFEYEDRGLLTLKGVASPVRAHRVLGRSTAASRFDAAMRGQLTPLIGRDQEVGFLLDRWTRSRSGEGQVVLLQGEPGIGKSRVLHAFRERIGKGLALPLQFQCSPYYSNSAFYPFVDHLERALGFARDDSDERRLERLEQLLMGQLKRSRTDCSLLARAMAIPCARRYGELEMSPQRQKEDTVVLLVDLIEHQVKRRATAVLFEDVHWADPTTVEVLSALVDRAERVPLLVVLTYRPEFATPWLSCAHVTQITLNRLSRAQGASVVLGVVGDKPLPAQLVTQIVDKTDGVPLFLEELTKAVRESEMLVDLGDRYDFSGKWEKVVIPNTLRDSLMARLDRLIPVKEIAQIGAAIGREFSYELVHAVTPMHESQLVDALERLTESGLVFRRGAGENASYLFKHALVQDAAYDSLLLSKRQALHAQIARAIEVRFPDKVQTEPELLAYHYTRGGLIADAISYWQKAGALAETRVALQEAVNSYRQAIQLLTEVERTQENKKRHIDIAIRWANLIVPSEEIVRALEVAELYAMDVGDERRLATVLSFIGQLQFYIGQLEPAMARLQAVIGMADALTDRDRVGSAYRCLGQVYLFGYSRFEEGLDAVERALPVVQASANRFEESCCYGLIGLEQGLVGEFEKSFASFDKAVRVARCSQERSIESWNLKWRSHIHVLRGEWNEAATHAADGLALAERIENVWAASWCSLVVAYAKFFASKDLELIERARSALDSLATTTCVAVARCYYAEMLYESGDTCGAISSADRAISELGCGTYFSAEARAYRIKGMAGARQPDPDWKAVTLNMMKAMSVARVQGRNPDLAICQFRYAQTLLHAGARAHALEYLGRSEALFLKMGMTWWLDRAHTSSRGGSL